MSYSVSGLPLVIKAEDKYYILDDETVSSYGKSFTMGEADEEQTINYTYDEDIVYFGEVENLSNAVYPVEGSFSGGKCAAISGSKIAGLTTLPKGTYKVSGYANDHVFRGLVLRKSNSVAEDQVIAYINTATDKIMSGLFTLTESTSVNLTGVTMSGKLNQSADLDYVLIRKISKMSIVGDFSANGWVTESGIAMTQSEENPAVWTAVVEDFDATAKSYAYKAIANQKWGDYELPSSGNATFDFTPFGAGTYTLNFTVNTVENTLDMTLTPVSAVYYVNTSDWGSVYAWVWNDSKNFTGGEWPGVQLSSTGEQVDGHDVYKWANYDSANTPSFVIFNDGGSNQTGNLAYVDNRLYGISWPEVRMTQAGYATYCSPYAIDFSTVENLTAYKATEADGKVTFVEVTKVPANTGVLVKGPKVEEVTLYAIPTIGEADAISDNALVGVLENTEVAAGAFVLMNGTSGVGFYKTTKAFTVGANTAYLPASVSARSFIGFEEDGETTGVSEALSMKGMDTDAPVYNLQGQRVNAPQRGLFIQNGKKYIVK